MDSTYRLSDHSPVVNVTVVTLFAVPYLLKANGFIASVKTWCSIVSPLLQANSKKL